jgi:hypothetical protein
MSSYLPGVSSYLPGMFSDILDSRSFAWTKLPPSLPNLCVIDSHRTVIAGKQKQKKKEKPHFSPFFQ